MKRTFLSLVSMAFIAAMTLTSCDEIMSTIDNPVGSYVQFNDSVLNLLPGQVTQNVATTISTEKVTYTSSDKSIATVDPNGFVTAISYGEAIITASVPANENYQAGSATYKVKVGSVLQKALKNGADVEIVLQDGENKIAPKFLNENNVFTLQNPLAGANSTLTYDKAKNLITFTQQVVVLPASETVITVIFDVTKNTYQAIPALSTTTAQFAAIKIYGDDVTGKVTKKEVAAEAVTITGAPTIPFIMAIGDADVTLKAEVSPVEATDKKVTWSSSAPAVATIDETGKVHAVAAGSTTIKATTANGKEASIELTVNLPKATVITAPMAITGVKAGEDKAIINAGVASGGTMMYALTTTNTKPTSLFGSTVPSAKNRAAGTYYVWYYVKADATHVDSEIAGPVQVTIASAIISTKDVSETFTPTAHTVTKTYFKVSGYKTLYGWQIGTGSHNTITISSPDGLNLSQVVLTVGTHPGTFTRNKSHLQVDHGTLTVTGTSQGSTITISGINSPSVTLSAPGSDDNASRWTFTQAVVDGKGDASK